MATSTKLAEAEKLLASGKKHCKKGFFKKPDWDSGASDLAKAAMIFNHLGNFDACREATLLASEAHANAGNLYLAGNVLEQLGNFYRDRQREPEGAKHYADAARFYAMADKSQAQADALAKAARAVGLNELDTAAGWMNDAIESLENSERYHMLKDPYRALVKIYVRGERWMDAIGAEKRYIKAMEKADYPDMAAKCGLEIVVLALALDDYVIAEREFQALNSAFGFPGSPEQGLAYDLLHAAEMRDADLLRETGKHTRFTFLIPEIARIAKKLGVPSGAPGLRAKPAPEEGAEVAEEGDADAEADPEEDTR